MSVTVVVNQPAPIEVGVELQDGTEVSATLPAPVQSIVVTEVGPRGEKGDQGDEGPPGPSGDDYVFEQDTPSDEWVVTHNLGRYPSGIQVIGTDGALVGTEIVHDSVNQFRSLSDGAISGVLTYT